MHKNGFENRDVSENLVGLPMSEGSGGSCTNEGLDQPMEVELASCGAVVWAHTCFPTDDKTVSGEFAFPIVCLACDCSLSQSIF